MGRGNEISELSLLLQKQRLILFVGAGVPASIGMPTWRDLINKMGGDLNVDPSKYLEYGDFLQLASYYESVIGSKLPLQEYIKTKTGLSKPLIGESKIYNSICHLGVRKLYTTNYDRTLEIAYHINKIKHKTIRTIDDFTDVTLDPQIIKFHGDVELLKTWVLTEEDYFTRLDFDHPLDIKLKSDLIGNSVLFIGYSFNDMNIRYLIYKINQLWQENKSTKKVHSYIYISDLNPVKESILKSYGIIPIYGVGKDPQTGLEQFLDELCNELNKAKAGGNI